MSAIDQDLKTRITDCMTGILQDAIALNAACRTNLSEDQFMRLAIMHVEAIQEKVDSVTFYLNQTAHPYTRGG